MNNQLELSGMPVPIVNKRSRNKKENHFRYALAGASLGLIAGMLYFRPEISYAGILPKERASAVPHISTNALEHKAMAANSHILSQENRAQIRMHVPDRGSLDTNFTLNVPALSLSPYAYDGLNAHVHVRVQNDFSQAYMNSVVVTNAPAPSPTIINLPGPLSTNTLSTSLMSGTDENRTIHGAVVPEHPKVPNKPRLLSRGTRKDFLISTNVISNSSTNVELQALQELREQYAALVKRVEAYEHREEQGKEAKKNTLEEEMSIHRITKQLAMPFPFAEAVVNTKTREARIQGIPYTLQPHSRFINTLDELKDYAEGLAPYLSYTNVPTHSFEDIGILAGVEQKFLHSIDSTNTVTALDRVTYARMRLAAAEEKSKKQGIPAVDSYYDSNGELHVVGSLREVEKLIEPETATRPSAKRFLSLSWLTRLWRHHE